jgi:cell wall assembly regulator SMI1
MKSVKKSLQRIQSWMKTNLHSSDVSLSSGVLEEEIQSFRKIVDIELPADFITLFKEANGEVAQFGPGLFFGLNFLSLSEIINHWTVMCRYIDKFDEYMDFYAYPEQSIQTKFMCRSWIPIFTDHAGNYVGIDLDPGFNGVPGQVINFGRDEDHKKVIADSLSSLLKWYADSLEDGRYAISGDSEPFVHLPHSHNFFTGLRENAL